MRPRITVTGIILIFVAILGYEISPDFIIKGMNSFTSGADSSSPFSSSLLSQMGIPSAAEMSILVQYCFIALAVAGAGTLIFGIVAKVPKQETIKMIGIETNVQKPKNKENHDKALRLLKERLAKGEISSSEFVDLKDLLEKE